MKSLSTIQATAFLKALSLPGKILVLCAMYLMPSGMFCTNSTPGTVANWLNKFLLTPSGLRTKSTSPLFECRKLLNKNKYIIF